MSQTRSSAIRCAASMALAAGIAASAAAQYRTFDGTDNNLANPNQGAAHSQLARWTTPGYGNDVWTMARQDVAGPRHISNAVFAQSGSITNSRGLSDMAWQWGQFLDHDIDLTPPGGEESVPIQTPNNDPYFLGTPIAFTRSEYDHATGVTTPRQQINEITSYIDASNVYGSDSARAAALRANDGTGRLRTGAGNLLPRNTMGLENDNGPGFVPADQMFVAGDVRANEQAGLTTMHTLFMREHNRWADRISDARPDLTGEEVFQRARAIVGAEMQAITYNEWIPAMTGASLDPYTGYSESVDASIANVFSTAAFRFGHTMLSSELARVDDAGAVIAEGNLPLRDSFFNPANITSVGIEPYLRGLSSQAAQEIDAKIVDDVRNFLFGPPGAGGFDLASLNIQRGRDHGLPDYNTIRQDLGMTPVSSFSDISSDPEVQAALAAVYDSVGEIDPWVGMLAEDRAPGSSLGETAQRVILDQFLRLRDGDRYFYKNADDPAGLGAILADLGMTIDDIDSVKLSDIILANSDVTGIQDNVFFIPSPGAAGVFAIAGLAGLKRRRRN